MMLYYREAPGPHAQTQELAGLGMTTATTRWTAHLACMTPVTAVATLPPVGILIVDQLAFASSLNCWVWHVPTLVL